MADVTYTHGVASGDVTSKSAILWTRAVPADLGDKERVRAHAWLASECGSGQRHTKNAQSQASRDYTVKVDMKGLKPGLEYCYRFVDQAGNVSPTGNFRTAYDSHKKNPGTDVHITFDGDEDAAPDGFPGVHGPFTVLSQVQAAGPDFYAAEGDNVYSDSHHRTTGPATTLEEYRDAYRDVLTFPNLLNLRAATSQYPLMDDHEVLNDYDGQTVDPVRYANGRQAFLEYMPIREKGLPSDSTCAGKPLYRTYQWGTDVEVFVLDERSCRSASAEGPPCNGDLAPTAPQALRETFPFNLFLTPNPPPGCLDAINDPTRTVLGPVQKAKFKNDLLSSPAKFKFVLNEYAIQQWYALPYDRWEGYGAERQEILNHIRDNQIENVVFLTTDHHATIQNEVFIDFFSDPDKIAYDFVTGPIGTETLRQEVLAGFGPLGLFAFTAILNTVQIDCKNLDKFSWGDVLYDADTVTASLTSRDELGATILDDTTAAPCTQTEP